MNENNIKEMQQMYNEKVKQILNIKTKEDIKLFSSRKTISLKTIESTRSNETKLVDAIKDSTYTEGDRCWVFYKSDDSLCLVENFDGDYNKVRLLKNLYDTISIFDSVIDVKKLFINYSLKKNQKLLENL